jgi:membrane-bound lytic murein transglycosylase D
MAHRITAILLFVLVTVVPAAGAAGSDELFPRPANLEANIAFWKMVFTQWGERDLVIHDAENLQIVYEVIPTVPLGSNRKAKRQATERVNLRLTHYANLLRLLEQQGPEQLGEEGARLYELWGCPCPPGTLGAAADRLHFQRGIRERFAAALRRSEQMRPQILPVLRRHGVPDELAALPLIESAFDARAVSQAKAVGLWQFIRATARRFGLIVRGRRDDRRDPLQSTTAAARMLQHHYGELNSWPLAITAYNHGLEGVRRAKATVGTDDIGRIAAEYRGRRFGFASRNFYAEFLAATDLMDLHFAQLQPQR